MYIAVHGVKLSLRQAASRVLHNTNRLSKLRSMFSGPGSDKLLSQSCAGSCSRAVKLSDEEIDKLLPAVPAWKLSETRDKITRTFVARNFKAAIAFFNKVMEVAEADGHHPDLHLTGYRNVQVDLFTHALGALAISDFVVAAKIDALEVDYSPKWLEQQEQSEQ